MSFAYGEPRPCSRKARFMIGGRELCQRHAQSLALKRAVKEGSAVEIPGTAPHNGGLVFIDEMEGK